MDDYTIKVLSWLGISMVTTYRILWVKLYKNIRQAEERNKRKRIENIKTVIKLITNDTKALINWMKDDQTDTTWMEPVTKHESIKFQMVLLVDESVTVTYRIIILQDSTADKKELLKWIGENIKQITVCNRGDNKLVTEWIKHKYSTLTETIVKDANTFINMIAGDHERLDEQTKQDIKTLTEMIWLSSSNTYRNYDIVLSKPISNKGTMAVNKETYLNMIKLIEKEKESMNSLIQKEKNTLTDLIEKEKEAFTQLLEIEKNTMADWIAKRKDMLNEWIHKENETMEVLMRKKKDKLNEWIQKEKERMDVVIRKETDMLKEWIEQEKKTIEELIGKEREIQEKWKIERKTLAELLNRNRETLIKLIGKQKEEVAKFIRNLKIKLTKPTIEGFYFDNIAYILFKIVVFTWCIYLVYYIVFIT
ncbi:uncharacterized protein LOC134684066 [Mytilus trossulus]|uniref:uncharacterized protein LOC134684066 n=1 Tax=Mytilus trossulus TaxID=6551 RepID=UPI00300412DD